MPARHKKDEKKLDDFLMKKLELGYAEFLEIIPCVFHLKKINVFDHLKKIYLMYQY